MGFDHNCVLSMNDYKTISKNRIISTCGNMDISSESCLYRQIRKILLHDIFADEIKEYEEKIVEMEETIKSLFSTIRRKNIILTKVINKNKK